MRTYKDVDYVYMCCKRSYVLSCLYRRDRWLHLVVYIDISRTEIGDIFYFMVDMLIVRPPLLALLELLLSCPMCPSVREKPRHGTVSYRVCEYYCTKVAQTNILEVCSHGYWTYQDLQLL